MSCTRIRDQQLYIFLLASHLQAVQSTQRGGIVFSPARIRICCFPSTRRVASIPTSLLSQHSDFSWFAYVCVRPSSDHAEREVVMHQQHSFAPVETRVHDEESSAASCIDGIFLWHTIGVILLHIFANSSLCCSCGFRHSVWASLAR